MSMGAGFGQPVKHGPFNILGDVYMNVEIRSTQSASPVTYQYVKAVVMDENGISIIQETETERTTRSFDVWYSATIIK